MMFNYSHWRTQEFSKVQNIALMRGACLFDGKWTPPIGNWLIRHFLHAELHSKVSGARVGRVLIYVCVKCGHASALRRLDVCP